MLYPIPDGVCLQKLGGIEQCLEICRIKINLLQIIHDLSVCAILPLMLFHYIRKNIHIPRVIRESLDRPLTGKRLEAEFRSITEEIFPIFGKRPVPMPYFPVMDVSPVRAVRLIKGTAGGRACGPVKGLWVIFLQYFRDQLLIHNDIITHFCFLRNPVMPLFYKHLHFIISTPEPQ